MRSIIFIGKEVQKFLFIRSWRWTAAILNSEEEFHFVWPKNFQIDNHSFLGVWGTTNSIPVYFGYSEYIPNNTGIILLPLFSLNI